MPKILVSYRRDDSAAYAGRIADRLRDHFGRENVFVDIDTIRPGDDFVESIDRSILDSDALVVVIGRSWVGATDAAGRRRLDREDDFVRMEIAKALQRRMTVIPTLVGDAVMPAAADLTPDLVALSRRQAIEISDTRFHEDVDRLIDALPNSQAVAPPPPSPTPRRRPLEEQARGSARSLLTLTWTVGTVAIVLVTGAIYWTFGSGRASPASAGSESPTPTPSDAAGSPPAPAATAPDSRGGQGSPTSAAADPGAQLQAPTVAPAVPGKTGIQIVWRGTTTLSCYLYDETGTKMLSPGWPLPWLCSKEMGIWDAAPGKYQIKFDDGAETMSPLPVTVTRGSVLRVEPPLGQLRLHWNGSNWSRWYLMDKEAKKTLSSDYNPTAWYCEAGATCIKELGPGEYTVKMGAAGYDPVKVTIGRFRVTDLTLP